MSNSCIRRGKSMGSKGKGHWKFSFPAEPIYRKSSSLELSVIQSSHLILQMPDLHRNLKNLNENNLVSLKKGMPAKQVKGLLFTFMCYFLDIDLETEQYLQISLKEEDLGMKMLQVWFPFFFLGGKIINNYWVTIETQHCHIGLCSGHPDLACACGQDVPSVTQAGSADVSCHQLANIPAWLKDRVVCAIK